MNYSRTYAAAAFAALLSGCAGGGSTVTPTTTIPQSVAVSRPASVSATASAHAPVPHYHLIALASLGGSVTAGISDNEENWISGFSVLADNAAVHAALWYPSSIKPRDLLTLGGSNSAVEWPNHMSGHVVGISQIAKTDPLGEQWSCSAFIPYTGQECRGFVWSNGAMSGLGTLGGDNSFASGSNEDGQIVGWAETAVHDSTCVSPQVLQFEAVMWNRGHAMALRPLPGDPDSAATAIDDRGDAVGISGICENAVGALSAEHMVLWHNGVPRQLPSFGGSAWNTPEMINDEDDVVGTSDFPGDQNGNNFNGHAFLWTPGGGIVDLGLLSGDVVSQAYSINDLRQIVGQSCSVSNCSSSRAFLYQNGKMYDLESLLDAKSSGYTLIFANDINDEGQITGLAVDPNGAIVGFRLMPEDENDAPVGSGQAVTMRSRGALSLRMRLGAFARPIITR